jgi:AraC-like DNA-binding protein/ligand-binding sensor protein
MSDNSTEGFGERLLKHPLMQRLGEVASRAASLQALVVYPSPTGWGNVRVGHGQGPQNSFCRLIQSKPEGARQCRMCHVLMAVSACNGGPPEQHCHAGAAVLVAPAAEYASEALAVISSCMSAGEQSWEEARQCALKLGLDIKELRKAFLELPILHEEQRKLAMEILGALGSAVRTMKRQAELEGQVRQMANKSRASLAIEELLRHGASEGGAAPPRGGQRGRPMPMLIRVVCDLIDQRSEVPLSVKEIAAAAKLTPNHFTSLFRRHTGTSFTEYLAERRIERAKTLLRDLTLTVAEVAHRVGYDDAGYFTRRFRQLTGHSPREWREQGGAKQPAVRVAAARGRKRFWAARFRA